MLFKESHRKARAPAMTDVETKFSARGNAVYVRGERGSPPFVIERLEQLVTIPW